MNGRRRRCNQRFQRAAPDLERFTAKVPVVPAKQIEEHKRRWSLPGEKIHARCGRMKAKLQGVEVETVVPDDDNLAVEHTARRQGSAQRVEQLGKVAVERLLVAAL